MWNDPYVMGYDRPRANKYDFIGLHSQYAGHKAFEVANVLMKIAREKDVGRRWFHYMNPDILESVSMLFPAGKHKKGEPVTKEQLEQVIARISNYVKDERDRFNAQKEKGRKIPEWESQYETREQMAKEWELLKKVANAEMAKYDRPVRRRSGVRSASPKSRKSSRRRRTRSAGGKRRGMKKITRRRRR